MAEWLGRALQKLPQRFESARDLQSTKNETLEKSGVSYVMHVWIEFQLDLKGVCSEIKSVKVMESG